MSTRCKAGLTPLVLLLLLGGLVLVSTSPHSQGSPELVVSLPDTAVQSGAADVSIPVYMQNPYDAVSAFSMWIQLDRSDLMEFRLAFDTVGTLLSGWEFLEARHLGGQPYEIKITGMCDLYALPVTPPIEPQTGSVPLIRLTADFYEIPDTLTERTVQLRIYRGLQQFSFSDPDAELIGTSLDSVLDTAYFRCEEWDGDECLEWTEVAQPPCDSLDEYYRVFAIVDPTLTIFHDGSYTLLGGYICGDIDGEAEVADIADLVYLVEYMFRDGPLPPSPAAANLDGQGEIDISDLVYLVDYMFTGGPAPVCGS